MKNIKKLEQYLRSIETYFKTGFCALIMISVVYSSINTSYTSHISFYNKKLNDFIIMVLSTIGENKNYALFLDYTGLNTGYGFFSPNVSSDLLITHNLFTNGTSRLILSNSEFKTKEGASRFANLNSVYMAKIEAIENKKEIDTLKSRYLEVILKRLSKYQLNKDSKVDSVRTDLYLYHFPLLVEYPEMKSKFIPVESHTKIR